MVTLVGRSLRISTSRSAWERKAPPAYRIIPVSLGTLHRFSKPRL